MKNRIYYFTGTGNCLKLAKDVAEHLGDCELISIGSGADYVLHGEFERIGIIFPVYYQGLPLAVCDAVERINWQASPNAYFFSIATYGAMAGNALAQLARLMQRQDAALHYSAKLAMFSNCITLYNMSAKVEKITQRSDAEAKPIIEAVAEKQCKPAPRFCGIVDKYYQMQIKSVPERDYGFNVDADCTSCGICQKVCPVKNIVMEQGKPVYQHHCEQCLACIQLCPNQAINYKRKTQKRRRYRHPVISVSQLMESRLPIRP